MFTKKIQSSRANGNINMNGYPNDSNGYNTDRYLKQDDSRQYNSNMNQRKTLTSGQFTHFKKIQPQKNTQLVIRQCDPSQLNIKKNVGRQSQEIHPTYQFGSNKKEMIPIGSRKKYDSGLKQPMVEIHYSDRQNSQNRRSSHFQSNSQIEVLTEQFFKLREYVKENFFALDAKFQKNSIDNKKTNTLLQHTNKKFVQLTDQITTHLTKQNKEIFDLRNSCNQSKKDIQSLHISFLQLVKDQQQKMQNIVLDGNMKKSKHFDEFGVDLKSSSQCLGGMGTSMSVNFGGQNLNLKLYNQLSIQLQTLKNQLEDCKQKITKLSLQKKEQSYSESKEEKSGKNQATTIQFYQIQRIISEKITQLKKNINLNQKQAQIDVKLNRFEIQIHNQEINIKGMNDQFNRVLNTIIIPREKVLEQKVKTCQETIKKISQKEESSIKSLIEPQVNIQIQKQIQKMKILKVRNQKCKEKQALTLANKENQNVNQIYMLDENNYLIDSQGYYLIQNSSQSIEENKKKIKIQEEMLYLLQVNGIQISKIR